MSINIQLLAWLSRDTAAYGECYGEELDQLHEAGLINWPAKMPWPPTGDKIGWIEINLVENWQELVSKDIRDSANRINEEYWKARSRK